MLQDWALDSDGDGYGDPAQVVSACAPPSDHVALDLGEDCDDSEATTNPGALEICNDGLDNNCDGGSGDCGLPTGASNTDAADLALTGSDRWSNLGRAVGFLDFDGDGVDDLVVNAWSATGAATSAGESYVFYGPVSGAESYDADLTLLGTIIRGYAGWALADAGDTDGDGVRDLLTDSGARVNAPYLGDVASIPEHLPGEPPSTRRSGAAQWPIAVVSLLLSVGLLLALAPAWLVYGVLVMVRGRPPNVPRAWQYRRYLGLIRSAQPPPPGLPLAHRATLVASLLQKLAFHPVRGLAWILDELAYGGALDDVEVRMPLFEISAGRSGSTQIARYLEDDPALVGPSLLQAMFPYLWLWKLVPVTIGRFFSMDQVRRKVVETVPPALLERHELDPFRIDTFDGVLFTAHLNELAFQLGPDVAAEDFAMGHIAPHNRALWEEDFPALVDRIGRKCLLLHGGKRRLFIKGHFLAAAPALAARFPDARFLTVIRRPSKRLQSAINYIRVNPADPLLGTPPWPWLVEAITRTERRYNDEELAWYTAPGPTHRCVVRFDEYVRDLGATLDRVYAECMEGPPPPGLPREHPPRRRDAYQVDRSLDQLKVDGAAFDAAQAPYVAWCGGAAATLPMEELPAQWP